MDYYNMRFPVEIEYNYTSAMGFNTSRTQTSSGYIQNMINFKYPIGQFQVSTANNTEDAQKLIKKFFMQVKGGGIHFRFKDWLDYTANTSEGIFNEDGLLVGDKYAQMFKKYQFDTNYAYTSKPINKPVVNTVNIYLNNTLTTYHNQLNFETGQLELPLISSKSITAIAKDAVGTVTCINHGFLTNYKIRLDNIIGMSELNGIVFTITKLTNDTFKLNIDTTQLNAYVSAGNAELYLGGDNTTQILTWSGEFDLRCMFANDSNDFVYSDYNKVLFTPKFIEIINENL